MKEDRASSDINIRRVLLVVNCEANVWRSI